jgi:hypothetical protein
MADPDKASFEKGQAKARPDAEAKPLPTPAVTLSLPSAKEGSLIGTSDMPSVRFDPSAKSPAPLSRNASGADDKLAVPSLKMSADGAAASTMCA